MTFRAKQRWSAEDDATIKAHYWTHTLAQIGDMLECTAQSVRDRISALRPSKGKRTALSAKKYFETLGWAALSSPASPLHNRMHELFRTGGMDCVIEHGLRGCKHGVGRLKYKAWAKLAQDGHALSAIAKHAGKHHTTVLYGITRYKKHGLLRDGRVAKARTRDGKGRWLTNETIRVRPIRKGGTNRSERHAEMDS